MESAARCILVVDDSPDTLEVLERNLTHQGFSVVTAPGVGEALRILEARAVDLVITDLKMPGVSGLDLVRYVRENRPDTAALMITGYPSLSDAVEAVKSGAEDFLAKPFTDEELLRVIGTAFARLDARRAASGEVALRHELVAESPGMRQALRVLGRAAASRAPVLLVGEVGSGKERVARAIHYAGAAAARPFLCVRLEAVPPARALAELFGEPGLDAMARSGTLLVEDVHLASPPLQEALLRAASRREPEATRLMAATPLDLGELARRGRFLAELAGALGAFRVELPPLRERGDDLLLLVRYFASRHAARAGLPAPRFTDAALDALRAYGWPGNVAELRQVVERLAATAGEAAVDVADLPAPLRYSPPQAPTPRTLAEVEAEHLQRVLEVTGGNRTRAAEILDIDRKTLREKLKRLGRDDEGEP